MPVLFLKTKHVLSTLASEMSSTKWEGSLELCCLLIFNYQTRPKDIESTEEKAGRVVEQQSSQEIYICLATKGNTQIKKEEQAHKKRIEEESRRREKSWPAVGTSCWIIQQMSWQHFNLSLRFVGRLDKELNSRRVGSQFYLHFAFRQMTTGQN